MSRRRVRATIVATLAMCALAAPAFGQNGKLHEDFRREGERVKEHCGSISFKTVTGCATTVVTDHPVHLALGSIAPQNGFGFGVAFVENYTPNESWRLTWNADAVGAPGGAWRAGVYMKIIHTDVAPIGVVGVPPTGVSSSTSGGDTHTVINVYGQAISLPTLWFFGLGPDSLREDKTSFGLHETIVGASAIAPVSRVRGLARLHLALLGEINGRFATVDDASPTGVPAIGTRFTEATAPGLADQPAFLQLGEGVRMAPVVFGDRLRLNYTFLAQQFVAPSDSHDSFRRWTIDLDHEIPIYRDAASAPAAVDTLGPDECRVDPATGRCVETSRNRTGTIGVRLLVMRSGVSGSSVVPFYLQPTLGGSDVNGQRLLASYDDYRFRGPNLVVLRESVEHSIAWLFGAFAAAEQGTVGAQSAGLGSLRQSYSAGVTIRAGGAPMIVISEGWGPNEGRHFAVTMNTSLLGGSSRPSVQ